jgi:parvulin-like peptidyl-prolyl isomerase
MLKLPALSLAILLTSFAFVNTSFASDKIASIGKYEVTKQEAELATKMAGLGEFDKLSFDIKKVVVTRLLNDKVIEAEAKKEKLDEQTEVAMASRSILVSKYIEKHSGNLEVLAKKKYDETVGGLIGKKTYTLSHILVKDDSEANKIYKALSSSKNWKPEFQKMAKEKSIDTATAKNGGLVGSVPEMKLPEEFVRYIINVNVNTIIVPFKTSLGYHIAFVEKVEPLHIEAYEKVKQVFIGQIFQEETDRLAKENLKGKEIKFDFAQ